MPRDFCAIDFGTSNSAISIAHGDAMRLVELEPGFTTMPTAVFYNAEDESRSYGRAAVQEYVDGYDGRLMRSIKSILGSDLMDAATEIGHGISIKYQDVVIGYLKHLKRVGEAANGAALDRVIIGRPVWFVDGNDLRDARAEDSLATAARAAGFRDVAFQYEPIAAALDYEATINHEEIVLVADIGGGTSDFSLVRVGPARHALTDRGADILANHGVHVAGTDFDQSVNLAAIMPLLGFGSTGLGGRRVPGKIYHDLATWHLINTVYAANRTIELKEMASMYADQVRYRRLMGVVTKKLGHQLAAQAEQAKIDVALTGHARVALDSVEPSLETSFDTPRQAEALDHKVMQIVRTAEETLAQAGLAANQVGAVYFTGGSTGLSFLTSRIAQRFPAARAVKGDRFASVAGGLGIHARRRYASA